MINGDSPNGMLNSIIYFFQCVKNHRVGNSSRININTIKLSLEGVETFYKSPSRLLSDAFWNSINFTDLETQLKGKLHFFDIGCGTGEYGRLIKKLSGDSFGSYVGLDIYKNENFPTEFTHVLDAAKNAGDYIEKKTNVVISQSALEHIEGDLSVLHAITAKLTGNPFVQIHLVPASASLWLYLWHGWRQYSKRNLGQVLDTISRDFQISHSIVPLGDSLCFWTHLIYITIPYYLTKRHFLPRTWRWCDHPNVERKIVDAVSNELLSSEKLPTFWAFVIASKDVALKYKS